MLIAWGDILSMAAVTGASTFILTLIYAFWKKQINLVYLIGLGLVATIGFVTWFIIFNFFSLSSLDHDLPIAFFPVSPEDISCATTVSLVVALYNWLVSLYAKTSKWQQSKLLVSILAVVATLVVDVYFI
jgi:hypothetical protein